MTQPPNQERLEPAEIWPLASFIRDELEERGWTEADLAQRMSAKTGAYRLGNIMCGARLEIMDARLLSKALGGSPEMFLNLDRAFWDALSSGLYHLVKEAESVHDD